MENHIRNTNYTGTIYSPLTKVTTPYTAVRYYDMVQNYFSQPGDKKKPTNHSYETLRRQYPFGSRTEFRPGYNSTGGVAAITDGVFTGGSLDQFVDTTWHRSRVYNKALSKLNDMMRGTLDLSVSVAEYHQLGKMLSGIGKLKTYVSNPGSRWIKQTDLHPNYGPSFQPERIGKDLGKTAGKNWLQYQYGWKPLLSDIYDSITEFYHSDLRKILEFKVKVYDKLPSGGIMNQFARPITFQRSGLEGCEFHIRLKNPGKLDIARWSSLNPLSIAWELMPYSFVVDWFLDVGGTLRNLETALLYDNVFDSGYVTELYVDSGKYRVNGFLDGNPSPGGYYDVYNPICSDYDIKKFYRTVLGGFPLPRLPSLKVPTDYRQLLSAASLLSQHLR